MNYDLRVTGWDDYVGQEALKEHLLTRIESANILKQRLPHTLLISHAGMGKTSIVNAIVERTGRKFYSAMMPIKFALFHSLMKGFKGICFLDELHRLTPKEQEPLLTVLEDHYLQLPNGQRVYNNDITFIGATTEADKVIATLYERFPCIPSFDPYSLDEMSTIIQNMGERLGLVLYPSFANGLAAASGGRPRMAASLVLMARDLVVAGDAENGPDVDDVLKACRVTKTGLTENHVRYLATLNDLGGTAGVKLIANHLRLPEDILLDLERLLVDQQLITYTKSGRSLTMQGQSEVEEISFA